MFLIAHEWFGKSAALITTLLWALSFFAAQPETEARMYAMALTFSLASSFFCIKILQNKSRFYRIGYAMFALLSVYTHYYTGWIIAAHILYFAIQKQPRKAVITVLILALGLAPWAPAFFFQIANGASKAMPPPHFLTAAFIFPGMLGILQYFQNTLISILIATFYIVAAAAGAKQKTAPVWLLFIAPFAIPLAVSLLTPYHIFNYRYAYLFAPYFIMFISAGLFKTPAATRTLSIAFLLFVNCSLVFFTSTGASLQRENWRNAAGIINSKLRPGDAVFLEQGMSVFPLAYYLPNRIQIDWKEDGIQLSNPYWQIIHGESSLPEMEQIANLSKRRWLVLFQIQVDDPSEKARQFLLAKSRRVSSWTLRSFGKDGEIRLYLFSKS